MNEDHHIVITLAGKRHSLTTAQARILVEQLQREIERCSLRNALADSIRACAKSNR